jgi:PAS domain S-box-containing protein
MEPAYEPRTVESHRPAREFDPAMLLDALLNYSPDLIYFLDRQLRVVCCSNALSQFCGRAGPEESLGRGILDEIERFVPPETLERFRRDLQGVMETGSRIIGQRETETHGDGRVTWTLSTVVPWCDSAGHIIGAIGITRDVTALKEAEDRLERLNIELRDASRQAGRAEVATNVLHNVGNVLNSVSVSATLMADQLRGSKMDNLAKLVSMLEEHRSDLGQYLTTDPRGQRIPTYIGGLLKQLSGEREALLGELGRLHKNLEHIHNIVAMQQAHARTVEVVEPVSIVQLIEDALHVGATSLSRHGTTLVRDYQCDPKLTTDKHKVLQILINLLRNAMQACDATSRSDKQITVRLTNAPTSVEIAIIDNGLGIPPENLSRIFNHGFTTRTDGHGFGLHSSVLAAKQLGGTLTARSEGPCLGATFLLELPTGD